MFGLHLWQGLRFFPSPRRSQSFLKSLDSVSESCGWDYRLCLPNLHCVVWEKLEENKHWAAEEGISAENARGRIFRIAIMMLMTLKQHAYIGDFSIHCSSLTQTLLLQCRTDPTFDSGFKIPHAHCRLTHLRHTEISDSVDVDKHPFLFWGNLFWSQPGLSITVFSYVSVCFFLKADISIPPSKTNKSFLSFNWLNLAFSDCHYCFQCHEPSSAHQTKLIFALFIKQFWTVLKTIYTGENLQNQGPHLNSLDGSSGLWWQSSGTLDYLNFTLLPDHSFWILRRWLKGEKKTALGGWNITLLLHVPWHWKPCLLAPDGCHSQFLHQDSQLSLND